MSTVITQGYGTGSGDVVVQGYGFSGSMRGCLHVEDELLEHTNTNLQISDSVLTTISVDDSLLTNLVIADETC